MPALRICIKIYDDERREMRRCLLRQMKNSEGVCCTEHPLAMLTAATSYRLHAMPALKYMHEDVRDEQ